MADTLPGGHTARAPRPDDVEHIAELVRSYTLATVGIADYTEDDAHDDLTEPGFDPDLDGRLVLDRSGRPAGYATTSGKSDSDQVGIDVVAADPLVSRWLFGWSLGRARDMGRERGHPRVTVDHGVYRADEALRTQLTAHGFHVATTFHRMRVDHAHSTAPPEPPAGVVLRQATDAATRRAAHTVLTTAFAEHFGFVPEPYESWHGNLDRRSTFDWSQLWVAELDGRPVGALECNDQFADDERCGYVANIGVLPDARGRGVAKYLLRHAFATDTAAGRTGTILHVDSNNTTPALGLYESVGMHPFLVIDVWRRTVVST
ncbi:GNAT family N-acetyltransferase [Actinophytocola sp.]|uniref:GNAT family N-acetyltransferase n=1 Tax=Actinophytocola sp. TaxID=1872138 RepID=UPI0025C0BB4E|nr:GNAT family N-acetyltransferase [Actinophytocola sp.]